MFLTRSEILFLDLLAEHVRGDRAISDASLWEAGRSLGMKTRRELLFLSESFREDGDVGLKFTPREIGSLMRKRFISRLLDWGCREGLCDSCRMGDEEFTAWLTGMMRDGSLDFKERKWAAETWLRLRGQDVKKSSVGDGSGGAKVQIVINNPYGSGGVGGGVEVREVGVSGALNEGTECKS